MDGLEASTRGNRASKKRNQQSNFNTSNADQRARLLTYLLAHHSITTLQARKDLDVMHPAGRIKELRARGHHVVTEWTTEDSGKANHRIARYVLLARLDHD